MARSIPPRPPRRCSRPRGFLALSILAALPACRVEVTSGAPPQPAALAAPRVAPEGRPGPAARAASPQASASPPPPGAARLPPPWGRDLTPPDPEARRLFLRASQPHAALTPAPAPPRVTALALENTARGEAAGMRPEGEPRSADLAEGERAAMPVTLAPGECATFIAQGGMGLVEVDLFLTVAGPSREVIAEDASTGPIAVIGGRGACVAHPGPGPLSAELHVQARRGAGVVLVRGYRRGAPDARRPAGAALGPDP